MAINIFPFTLLVRNEVLPTYPGLAAPLADSQAYIQSLHFLFFNICVPLGVFRLLHALEASIKRHRAASMELQSSHAQHQEIFENAGGPIVLCDTQGRIFKANTLAGNLIGTAGRIEGNGTENLFTMLACTCADESENSPTIRDLQQGHEFASRDGRLIVIEKISPTSENHHIVLLRDISQIRRIQEALDRSKEREHFLSSHDQLTHLPNQELLRAQLQQRMAVMQPQRQLALIVIRLNSIKYVNDAHGNATGDAVIVAFADELKRLLPPDSLLARLRSVVFSFIVESAHANRDVIPEIGRIRRSLPEEIWINNEKHPVQISMAVAFSRPGENSGDELIQRGKLALDTARKSNTQDVAVFDDEAAAQVRRRLSIEQAIMPALRENELRLVYQPKVTHDGDIVGLEALIRWRSATLG